MKRTRGTYARLICLRCRSRKVKCLLPDDESLQPSPRPQPESKACQRCRQNNFDCIVDYTTLGRPAQKRSKASFYPLTSSGESAETQPCPSSPSADTFMLSHPEPDDEDAPTARPASQPTNKELFDALMSPVTLFIALVRQDPVFASSITYPADNPDVSILAFLDHELTLKIDRCLVWHRFYHPSIPLLVHLRTQLLSCRPGAPEVPATTLLIAALFLIALDVPSDYLRGYKHLHSILRSIVFDVGQQVMLTCPSHMHAILALNLIADYLPLGLVSARRASPGAILGRAYLTCAKKIAKQLGLDSAHTRLGAFTRDQDQARVEASACLLWCQISMTEIDAYSDADHPRRSFQQIDPAIQSSLDAVRLALDTHHLPLGIMNAYITLQATFDEWEICQDIGNCGGQQDRIVALITRHEAACESLLDLVRTWARILHSHSASEQAFVLLQLSETYLQHRRLNVVGFAMFHVVLVGANPARVADYGADEVVRISDNIIDQLRAHSEDDPNRSSERKFLETYGKNRMAELQKQLVAFVSATDLKLDGVAHTMPTRRVATSTLFVCKDIVEGNAARYKGWGGMHENTDTILILFESCAQKIESMSRHGSSPNAITDGNLLAASAKMIRSLRRIMERWRRQICETEQRRALEVPGASMDGPTTGSTVSDDTTMYTAESQHWPDDEEFFAQWSSWPTFDALDFSQLFDPGSSGYL